LVDDDDTPAPFERPIPRAIDDVADLVDLDGAAVAWLDDEHVGVDAARDALAGGALPARIARRRRRQAVHGLRDHHRDRALPDARRTDEQEAGRKGAARDRSLQEVDEPVMAE